MIIIITVIIFVSIVVVVVDIVDAFHNIKWILREYLRNAQFEIGSHRSYALKPARSKQNGRFSF